MLSYAMAKRIHFGSIVQGNLPFFYFTKLSILLYYCSLVRTMILFYFFSFSIIFKGIPVHVIYICKQVMQNNYLSINFRHNSILCVIPLMSLNNGFDCQYDFGKCVF